MAKVETTVTFDKGEIYRALEEKARGEVSKDASKTAGTSSQIDISGEGDSLKAVVTFKAK